jgi:multidrug resistance efflux pump
LAISQETEQTALTASNMTAAAYKQAQASLDRSKLDLTRTRIYSPVDGYITNRAIQPGDHARSGQRALSVVDAASFWVDAYFEETLVGKVAIGDGASAKLMAYPQTLSGHVAGVGRGISVPNAMTDASGLATVNPVFTWVRLAQRVPVRIELDTPIPALVHLTASMTATASINR